MATNQKLQTHPIFCFGDWKDAERIAMGQRDPNSLNEAHRYAFKPSGYGILRTTVDGETDIPEAVLGNFKWCGLGEVTPLDAPRSLHIPGYFASTLPGEDYVFRIVPQDPDGIYVVDEGVWWQCRKEVFGRHEPAYSLTYEDLLEMDRRRARTFTPITDYAGDYELPVVLIKRELNFNEVELVSGPRH